MIVTPICRPIASPLATAITAGGVGGAWTPSRLFSGGVPGVAYDFSEASGLFQNSARTVAVTTAGDPIGSVTDLSGFNRHAGQAVGASRALWQGDGAVFDGSNDFLLTAAIDFTGTDSVTVIACIRKNSDAAIGLVVELGTGGKNGSFLMNAPTVAATPGAAFTSRGTANASAIVSSGVNVSTDYVLTGIGRISTDTSILRVNSTQVATSPTDQGTGNYRNGALYIGRRGVATNPFNGKIYRLIVIGRHLTADELAEAEAWVAAPLA